MKKITCALLLLSSFSVFAQTANQVILEKSLKPWQPLSIEDTGGVITLTMDEDSISNPIYENIVKDGICAPLWLEDKKSPYLKSTKEIHVLNKHSWAGLVFEKPKASCDEIGKAKDGNDKILLMTHTRMHSNN
jgi:hypothetical protein